MEEGQKRHGIKRLKDLRQAGFIEFWKISLRSKHMVLCCATLGRTIPGLQTSVIMSKRTKYFKITIYILV